MTCKFEEKTFKFVYENDFEYQDTELFQAMQFHFHRYRIFLFTAKYLIK